MEESPDYQLEHFVDLQIDDGTVYLVKAGLNLDDKGFLWPLSERPWHLNCTQILPFSRIKEFRRITAGLAW